MSAIIEKAKNDFNEAQEAIRKIEQAKIRVLQGRMATEKKLAELREKLPHTLAAIAMGNDEFQSELEQLKAEISNAENIISDVEPTLKGLDELQKTQNRKAKGPRQIFNRLARYERMKKYYAESPSPTGEHDLRVIANGLGMGSDLDEFLASLPKSAA